MSEVRRYTYTVDPVYDRESLIPMNRASEHFAPQGQYVSGSDHDAAVNVLRDELGAVKGEYDRAVNKVDALVESLTVAVAPAKDPIALPNMTAIKRWSIAELRFAGGKEHDVNYVPEVHYDAALAREAQLRVDREDDANTFNRAMEKLQRSEAALREELETSNRRFHACDVALKAQTFNYNKSQQSLTVLEQRAVELEGLVEEGFAAIPSQNGYDGLLGRMLAALKPPAPEAFVIGRSLNKQALSECVRQLNSQPGQHQDEVIERQKNLISSLRAELAESYSLGAKIQLQPVGFLHEHFRDAQDQQTGAIAWVEESLFCLPVYLALPVQAAEAVSERQHGIPGTSFQRLNKLANEGE